VTTKEKSLMPHRIRRTGLAGFLILAAVSVAVAGCGGSSKATTNAAATTTTPGGPGGGRFAAVRTCLAKNGITLPQRTPGQGRPPGAGGGGAGGIFGGGGGGGGAAGGGPPLPAGVTRAQYQAALAKCGGANFTRRTLTPAQKATQQAALVKFAACMRTNGIALPAPNTTGTGPVFNTSKLDTKSAKFTAAEAKCTSLLPARFGRGGGGRPPAGGTSTTATTAS
jgi:hypothetical protein